jgi:hypothetical protein
LFVVLHYRDSADWGHTIKMALDPDDTSIFFDPIRQRFTRFPAHWTAAARRLFLNKLGEFLAGEAIRRVQMERTAEEQARDQKIRSDDMPTDDRSA